MTLKLDLNKNDATMILDLSKAAPELKLLKGMLNWEPHPVHSNCAKNGFDLDIFVLSLNANGKVESGDDVVFFNNKVNANGSISVPVDNQTGEGEDDEFVMIDIAKLSSNRSQHEIFVFLHEADIRSQNFGMISSASFDIIDGETNKPIVQYSLTQNYGTSTALHVGSLVRTGASYQFHPVGVGGSYGPQEVANMYVG